MSPEDRREQLLDAALQVISRDGYGAVSIEAIAREADVTRPVVYNVFENLNELLFALLDRQERRALDQLTATISLTPDLTDLDGYLSRTIRELVAMVLDDPLTWRPIFLVHGGTPAAVRERIDRDREVVRRRMQQVVELALAVRGRPDGIDGGIVSHALVGMGEHFGRLLLERPEAVDVDRLAATVSSLLAALRP
ncbi:helix-turn-helix domain-containing protein [Patulibacter sp. NPDC049589]|uniref:TetR/AcrR family transcriptional regulator n=1 Tax=Patulibacter sp. NPDC049589 TaxID=3154731 RepID=UPI00343E0AE4